MSASSQNKYFLLLLLGGLATLGFVFFYMDADVAIPVQGRSMRGLGNSLIRADADASIKAVHVTEGAKVSPGMTIVSLNDNEIEAENAALKQEIEGSKMVLLAKRSVQQTLQLEYEAVQALANSGGSTNASAERFLSGEKASLMQEIAGTQNLLDVKRDLVLTLEREQAAIQKLVAAGLEPAGELRSAELAFNRARVDLVEVQSKIALLKVLVSGAEPAGELRKAELAVKSSMVEIAEIEVRISSLEMQVARNVAKSLRYKVVAPQAGIVLKLLKYNVGDVVRAGDPVAEIVPDEGDVIFEAKVLPADVAAVRVGNDALIALSAFNRYEVVPFKGHVTYLSPASLVDANGDAYFIVRVTPTDLEALPSGVIAMLSVGQAAEISIKSSDRSVLAFLLGPLIRGSSQVFTER
uniref:HlyD family efflux transporter periplasmic adaptor subunit n=1 Tax=Polynucleobacter sp. TaxID=2029855 RepID=UPI00404898C7